VAVCKLNPDDDEALFVAKTDLAGKSGLGVAFLEPLDVYLGSILQNSIAAKNISHKFSSSNFGKKFHTQKFIGS
jgi:hypothetical protein